MEAVSGPFLPRFIVNLFHFMGWGYSSVVECGLGVYKVLGSILNASIKGKKSLATSLGLHIPIRFMSDRSALASG